MKHAAIFLVATAVLLVAILLAPKMAPAGEADLVVIGPIRTLLDSAPRVQGMAVKDGRILYVGTEGEARRRLAKGGSLIELKEGQSVLPGFVDSHIHMLDAGVLRRTCNMEEPESKEKVLAIVAEYAKKNPNLEWITGSGWPPSVFTDGNPHKADLDAIIPDRPVFLFADDGHSAWANSKALSLLGITKDTPDPLRGRIERDPQTGEPTGALREDAAYEAEAKIPKPSDEFMLAALADAQSYLHSLGITSIQDAYAIPRTLDIYSKAAHSGQLTMKIVAAQLANPALPIDQVKEMMKVREKIRHSHLRADAVKIMMDGIMESKTAALIAPYEGTNDHGILNWAPKPFAELAERLDQEGFQIHVHAIGDAAVRNALDGLESARKANGPSANRHHIAHLELIDPADLPRFKELDVTANFQPYWCYADVWLDRNTLPHVGAERAERIYQIGSVVAQGTRLTLGSDWPVSTPNPFLGMQVGATRLNPKKPDRLAWLPNERVPLEILLKAYTLGGAWINRSDRETGSLEPGKAADFIIIDRDILEVPPSEVGKTRVLSTYVDGKKVYQSQNETAEIDQSEKSFRYSKAACPCSNQHADARTRFKLSRSFAKSP